MKQQRQATFQVGSPGGIGNMRDLVLTVHGDKIEAHKPICTKKQYATSSSLNSKFHMKVQLFMTAPNRNLNLIPDGSNWTAVSGSGSGISQHYRRHNTQLGGDLDTQTFALQGTDS